MVLNWLRKSRWLWWGVFLTALAPLLHLLYKLQKMQLGVDPARAVVQELGFWAAILLWLSLLITPLRRRLSQTWLIRFRRMLGLYAAFYSALHLLAFVAFIVGWRANLLVTEVTQRPYVIAGLLALLLMLPLVVTSTKKIQKRLGRNWQTLHNLVYIVALLVMLHIIWMIRASYQDAVWFGLILMFLLGERVHHRLFRHKRLNVIKIPKTS